MTQLTREQIENAIDLYKERIDAITIAKVCNMSDSSARMLIRAYDALKSRDSQKISKIQTSSRTMVNKVSKITGYTIPGAPEEAKEETPEAKLETPDNTAAVMVKILEALDRQEALLKKLCEAWEVTTHE